MEAIHPVTHRINPPEPHDVRPEYVRRREAARFLGISYGTLSNWASAGVGPSVYRLGTGKVVLYAVHELHDFINAGRVEMRSAA